MSGQNLTYDNPLIGRYASAEMSRRWGPARRFGTWRRVWLALAEAEAELGLTGNDGKPRIRPEQLDAMRAALDEIDFDRAAELEHRLRHDVMAHVHAFGEVCPAARDIIHLGATSAFVTDNAELILIRESLDDICCQVAGVIDALGRFAEQWRAQPTLGYTHYQPAQLTTVGKRATLWCFDFVLDLKELELRRDGLVLRGAKGTTGTQASFLTLFHGDHEKVRRLDRLVAEKLGFADTLPVTGQTYTRKIDTQILSALAGIGESASKWGNDLRLLAHEREIEEPFEAEQVGSSAMPYKRNPMRSERMCGLSRYLMGLPPMAAQTAATQWFERTLDDSAPRRLYLPQAFLAATAVLKLALNLGNKLVVNPAVLTANVEQLLPFIMTEDLLMNATLGGGDRQELHELLRRHSQAVSSEMKEGRGRSSDLLDRLKSESAFRGVDLDSKMDPARYVGRAPEQVDEFLAEVIAPVRERYSGRLGQAGELRV